MARYRLLIEYDGAPFAGWQSQPGRLTVQGLLEDALAVVLREPIGLTGSGRTDAGVHARGQVAHFDGPPDIDTFWLRRALNGVLFERAGGPVVILAAESAPETFHARYDARQRHYSYAASGQPRALDRYRRWLVRPEPDWHRMNTAAAMLEGRHHFGSFCITQSATENRICRVLRAEWIPEERPGDWRFEISADRFLHGMVRAVVGTLVAIGHGKLDPDVIPDILEAQDRRKAGAAAPALGLVLESVHYGESIFGAPAVHRPT